jgi:hypothetical protein
MSGSALAMMVVVLGLVWGGFVAAIALAMSREKQKRGGD